jgi:hypothetical protein
MLIKCTCDIVGTSPLSFGAPVVSVKNTGERHDDFEERTWRERMRSQDGELFISPMALKNCLSSVAKYLSESVPGKGKSTYTKHFVAGILVVDPLKLGVSPDDVTPERLFVPSDGTRGSGSRVWKTFPTLMTWKTSATIFIADPVIKAELVERYLGHAGQFIGLGRFRPEKNGYYGRFRAERFASARVSE